MIVEFDNLEEFLTDLRAAARSEKGEAVDDGIVRLSISARDLSQTSREVFLTAGFSSLGELRQLHVCLGTDFARQEPQAWNAAEAMAQSIRGVAGELQLIVRGGRFQE